MAHAPGLLSATAAETLTHADEHAVAAITWFELAWLARRGRIVVSMPVRAWLERLATKVRTIAITPAIAATAASLPASFPRDPADRLIYSSAVEHGFQLITKDERLLQQPNSIALW
jgi:PIN domain nuclease of toxin-antitoxin system